MNNIPMNNVPTVIAVIGGIALLIGIFGGGIRAKGIEIPPINAKVRTLSTITGMILIIAAAFLSNPELLQPRASGVPTDVQPTPNTTLPLPRLASYNYGNLLYEDTFDSDTGIWSFPLGGQIQNGVLILPPGAATVPAWKTEYSDFIFETEFQFINTTAPNYSGVSVYLRYSSSACPKTTGNCSDQVGVSTEGQVNAWRPNGTNTYDQILAETHASAFNLNGKNKLTVIVKKNEFQIFLNDTFVRAFNDSTYKSGRVILDTDGTSIAFDYVRIYALP